MTLVDVGLVCVFLGPALGFVGFCRAHLVQTRTGVLPPPSPLLLLTALSCPVVGILFMSLGLVTR